MVCSPGLKKVCLDEMLAAGIPKDSLEVTQGGIEFKGRLTQCLALNLNLRSPSRILMRIDTFKTDAFALLEKKIAAIDWDLYLPKACALKFSVTARKSRLYHSDAIAQRCEKSIREQIPLSPAAAPTQTIYIRAEQDLFTLSLDSTGDLLFKRGIKKRVTPAPLRENLAFAMLHWAGFSGEDILIDPMCGSGTFSLEAAMMKTQVPPGFFRSFAFEIWPGFSRKTYDYLKKQARKEQIDFPEKQIFASDIDDTAVAAMGENILPHDFNRIIDLAKKDFFSLHPSLISPGKKGVVMLNPPYGKRIEGRTDTRDFYREIGKKLRADFKGWRMGILLPTRESQSALGLNLKLHPIFHGGLELFAGIGKI